MSANSSGSTEIGTRWPELLVSLLLMLIAALVITDSIRVGIGWADDGPQSGYFPFYVGCLLLAASASVFIGQLWRWRQADEPFAEREQVMLVLAVFLPMVIYVAGIFLIGIYVASALLIGYFMRRYGHYGWKVTVPVAVGVPLFFFVVFERWFLVPLAKGPIERWLGF